MLYDIWWLTCSEVIASDLGAATICTQHTQYQGSNFVCRLDSFMMPLSARECQGRYCKDCVQDGFAAPQRGLITYLYKVTAAKTQRRSRGPGRSRTA